MGFLSLLFLAYTSAARQPQTTHIQFELQMPSHLRQLESVFISGDHPSLGSWDPSKIKMRPSGKGLWTYVAEVPAGIPIQFKFTLGDWRRIEVTNQNKNIPNRQVRCSQDCIFSIQAENFRLDPFHPQPRTTQGNIEYYHEVYSAEFDNRRSIAIYLPPGYSSSSTRYPVIYAMDGQNLFDEATSVHGQEWKLDEAMENLFRSHKIQPAIVVAIYSTTKRNEEYLMNPKFGNFIARQIKAEIDRRYRTHAGPESTFLLGSSFGGVFAFYAAWTAPSVFSRFAALSTAYWWNNGAIERMIKSSPSQKKPMRIWMDMGDKEPGEFSTGPAQLERAYQTLLSVQQPKESIHKVVIPGGTHDEISWSLRIYHALQFLLGNIKK